MSKNFDLSHYEFDTIATRFLKGLIADEDFTDVTLVCENNQQIKAHKVILGSFSSTMRNIILSIDQSCPVIYMKGVKYEELRHLIDFLYLGETKVSKDNLPGFMEIAQDLNIKGLSLNSGEEREQDKLLYESTEEEVKNIDYGEKDADLSFETTKFQEDIVEAEDNPLASKTKRGKNLEYIFVEAFEKKEDLDKFWNEKEFGKLYYHYVERASKAGSEDIFRCKFYSKSGFTKCKMHIKVSFPGNDNCLSLFITNASHEHERLDHPNKNNETTKFTWTSQPEAREIVLNGIKQNDFPSQIMQSLNKSGITPLPSYTQLNNKIVYLRKSLEIHGNITTSKTPM